MTVTVKTYSPGALRPVALLESGYLNRALHEIYSVNPHFIDPQEASRHRLAARQAYCIVRRQFPGTEFAARAAKNLAELAEGRNVYAISHSSD